MDERSVTTLEFFSGIWPTICPSLVTATACLLTGLSGSHLKKKCKLLANDRRCPNITVYMMPTNKQWKLKRSYTYLNSHLTNTCMQVHNGAGSLQQNREATTEQRGYTYTQYSYLDNSDVVCTHVAMHAHALKMRVVCGNLDTSCISLTSKGIIHVMV